MVLARSMLFSRSGEDMDPENMVFTIEGIYNTLSQRVAAVDRAT